MRFKPAVERAALDEYLSVLHLGCGQRVNRQVNPFADSTLGDRCVTLDGLEVHPFQLSFEVLLLRDHNFTLTRDGELSKATCEGRHKRPFNACHE
jgi:hypothetical protein